MERDDLVDLIIEDIAATAEVLGTTLSHGALILMAEELIGYPPIMVRDALHRCRRELKGRLTLPDVIERIEHGDGRPGPDEAWSTAVRAMDEKATVVLNDELMGAWSVAKTIWDAGDKVGARMAFRDAYQRIVTAARAAREPCRWWPSLGDDKAGRDQPLLDAVAKGLLAAPRVQALLPHLDVQTGQRLEYRGPPLIAK